MISCNFTDIGGFLSLCDDDFLPLILLLQFMKFHRELIAELEKKTDMDIKYMNVSIVCFSPCHTSHIALTCTYHNIVVLHSL